MQFSAKCANNHILKQDTFELSGIRLMYELAAKASECFYTEIFVCESVNKLRNTKPQNPLSEFFRLIKN